MLNLFLILGQELEQFFKSGQPDCEMLIAGFLYTIDFQNMLQVQIYFRYFIDTFFTCSITKFDS